MSDVRDLPDWSRFTRRAPRAKDSSAHRANISGKRILVTGAGGSIAAPLVKALAEYSPAQLILLDIGEFGLHELCCDLRAAGQLRDTHSIVGSITDETLLSELFKQHQPEIIFHTAACKHVPLMEANPFTAAATNVLGTEAVLRFASTVNAQQCVLLSTDKAVDPRSVMGATKRFAELLLLTQPGPTRWKALRLGNVLGSSGSVVSLFRDQIAQGGPVTVSHPQATRYFISPEDAVLHLLDALDASISTGILLPAMGMPHRVEDLAGFLIAEANVSGAIRVAFTGLRPGDKLEESLHAEHESLGPSLAGDLHLVSTRPLAAKTLTAALHGLKEALRARDLQLLLSALQTAVPEYQPSDLLLRHRSRNSEYISV